MSAIKPIPRKIQSQGDFMRHMSRKVLERNSQYMAATGLLSLLSPMWYANTLAAFRAKHGPTPAFHGLPELIGKYHGENGLEAFRAVMQLKNAIRLLEAQE